MGGASPTNTTNDLHRPAERNLIGTKLNTESDKNISGISAASSLAAVQRQPEKSSSSVKDITVTDNDKNTSGDQVAEDDDYEEDDYEEDDNNYEEDDAFEEEDDDSGEVPD